MNGRAASRSPLATRWWSVRTVEPSSTDPAPSRNAERLTRRLGTGSVASTTSTSSWLIFALKLMVYGSLWIVGGAAVAASGILVGQCTFESFSAGSPLFPQRGSAAWICGLCASAKSGLVMLVVNGRSTAGGSVVACAVWLNVVAFDCLTIALVVVPWRDGMSLGNVWLCAAILMMEITSGLLPVLALGAARRREAMTDPRASVSAQRQDLPAVAEPCPAPRPSQQCASADQAEARKPPSGGTTRAMPRFKSVRALVLHVRKHGCGDFPDLYLEKDDVLRASQRALARVFGRALSTINVRLRKEAAAGMIIFETCAKYTKVTLPAHDPGSKPGQ